MVDEQVERLEWLESKIDQMQSVIDNDGAFMFASDEDVEDFYRKLSEYERERDEIRAFLEGL